MDRAIAPPSSSTAVSLEVACHAGGRRFESRRSRSALLAVSYLGATDPAGGELREEGRGFDVSGSDIAPFEALLRCIPGPCIGAYEAGAANQDVAGRARPVGYPTSRFARCFSCGCKRYPGTEGPIESEQPMNGADPSHRPVDDSGDPSHLNDDEQKHSCPLVPRSRRLLRVSGLGALISRRRSPLD